MFFYKVVEVRQKSFMRGIMRAVDLQNEINQWAKLGWTLDRISAGETAYFLGAKDVFLIIFKKEITIPEGLFVMVNGQTVGPVDEVYLVNLRAQNLVNASTQATKKGMNEWKSIVDIIPGVGEFFMY